MYESCGLCPHTCGVNRNNGEKGKCRSGSKPVVASYTVHHGEEPPISGIHGSGTIFLSGCTGRCIFCQNYPISQLGTGNEITEIQLAEMMLDLQERGCHNINFVTPTHFSPSIVSAVAHAAERGLCIPIVYNTSGYERPEIIKLLDGVIDIYLPDAKYSDDAPAKELSGFTRYTEFNTESLKEMYRQVGDLTTVGDIAVKGIIIRHMILPEGLSGSGGVFHMIAHELSENVHVSLMDQYFPAFHAHDHHTVSRRITEEEYEEALELFEQSGLKNGWIQDHSDSLEQ